MTVELLQNHEIAEKLRQLAELLERQDDNPYRISAYRRAADTLEELDTDVARLVEERGRKGLLELPTIGTAIAAAILEILQTGRYGHLDRVRGDLDPVELFQSVPGIGPELARRIHETLGVETLEALETAAHDRSLQEVPGVGPRRAAAIRGLVSGLLRRSRWGRRKAADAPSVETLLEVDREYRRRAEAGELPTIAPKRFNPDGKAWLPVMNLRRGPWRFHALYSNTGRAHELGKTRDWVVLYFGDEEEREGQCTVVTDPAGHRVVRGREAECRALAAAATA